MSKFKAILISLIIILLISCFPTLINKQFMSKKPQTINKTEVVFWTLQLGTFDKYINNIISEFEEENPQIKIKWIDVPYSEGEKRTLAAILTDNPPDLVNVTPNFTHLLAQRGALFEINETDMEQFVPALSQMLKFKDKYYGIPFYATSAITLCNKIIAPEPAPKNYNELFNLTPKKNTYITMLNFAENDTILKLLNKYNINSPDSINSPKSVKLYEEFKRLYDTGLIPKESITQTHRDALEKYMAGQLAYLVTGANFLNMIKENAPDIYKNTKILPQLTGDTGKYDYSLMNFIIPLKSKNKEAALKFALFLTNEQNQLNFAKLTTILPVNKNSLKNEYFAKTKTADIQTQARIISAMQLEFPQSPIIQHSNKKELNTISANYIQEILINNAPIKDTLDKFANDWEKL